MTATSHPPQNKPMPSSAETPARTLQDGDGKAPDADCERLSRGFSTVLVPFWSPYPQTGHRDGFCHPQVDHAYLSRGPEGDQRIRRSETTNP